MLTIYDRRRNDGRRNRGGVSRRNFLQVGGLGLAGLSLPQVLASDAARGERRSRKSLIMIYLVGGPPHMDMWDLKPHAPVEVRGEFRPIATNVPGIELCEHLPRLAKLADKLAIVRSIVGAQDDHNAFQCYTGRDQRQPMPANGWPQLGAVVSKLQGPATPAVPPHVSLSYTCTHPPYNEPGPGFLGLGNAGFQAVGAKRENMVLQGLTSQRLADRRRLLSAMDQLRRDIDARGQMAGIDEFTSQAMDILSSSQLVDALDLSREDPRVVARYGTGDPTVFMDENGAPRVPQNFLMARRLVEAGARVVTVAYSKWDWHGGPNNSIFKRQREDLPVFDQAFSALIEDLHQRGLDRDVTVIAWGEFGRTPTINNGGGRDHWPRVSGALLAGGGMRTGQVIGATDRLGGEAIRRPVTFADMFATLYHRLGIDPAAATVTDLHGRPQHLVEPGAVRVAELG